MKTTHLANNGYSFINSIGNTVIAKMKTLGTWSDKIRIIECGKAVVLLPDTNTKADCSFNELTKAMRLTENEKAEILGSTPEKTRYYITKNYNNDKYIVDLSPQAEKFLNFLQDNDLLESEVNIDTTADMQVEEFQSNCTKVRNDFCAIFFSKKY